MKKLFVLGAVGVFLFSCVFSFANARAMMMVEEDVCVTSSAKTKIVLNEIDSFSSYSDWVELHNPLDQCVDLGDVSIWDSGDSIKTFASGTILYPGIFLNVDLNNRLNHSRDSVVLKYGEEEWDRFDYGSTATYSAAVEGEVWARFPDGGTWATATMSTPGFSNGEAPTVVVVTTTPTTTEQTPTTTENIATTTTSTVLTTTTFDYGSLRLNEVFSDPIEGNEWVEIFNIGATNLPIDSLQVCDNRLTSCKNTTGTISGESWFLFDLGTGFLNNSGDSAVLQNSTNTLDRVDFGEIGKGWSYARSSDGVGAWSITTVVTPAAANIISAPMVVSSGGGSGSGQIVTQEVKTMTQPTTSSFCGSVVINELLPDPDGADITEEFIEIKNISNSDIDLTGWSLGDKDKKYFISGKILKEGILFWHRDVTGIVLSNSQPDEVFLYDANGNYVDRIKYDKAENNKSYSRFTVGWKWTEQITSGKENVLEEFDEYSVVWKLKYPMSADINERVIFSAAESADPRGGKLSFSWDFGGGQKILGEEVEYNFVSSGIYFVNVSATSTAGTAGTKQIKINVGAGLSLVNSPVVISEVMSDPSGRDDQEYIEIWNSGSSTIDLSGWILRVGTKRYSFPDKTTIEPQTCLVFYRLVTKISLNNSGGKVELLAPGESVVDVVKFGKGASGKSYSLLGGEWLLTVPSPGVVGQESKVVASNTTKNGLGIWYKTMPILEAREQEKGVGVFVSGVVTVLPGVFGVQYFYIADDSAGIAVYQYKKDFPPIKTGDLVSVRGTVSEANSQKRINIKKAGDVDILKIEQNILPAVLSINELEEQPLGTLISIEGEITEKKSGYWYVDDGSNEVVVYFKKGTKIKVENFLEGQRVKVVGILEQGKAGLQVWPRSQEDLIVVALAKEIQKPVEGGGWGTYLSAAAGAATTLLLGFLARARGASLLALFGRGIKVATSFIKRG